MASHAQVAPVSPPLNAHHDQVFELVSLWFAGGVHRLSGGQQQNLLRLYVLMGSPDHPSL